MNISESSQEVLEQLWIAVEEQQQPGLEQERLSPAEADELQRLGLVQRRGRHWALTAAGGQEAGRAIRRHRLGERLLADVLMMESELIDEQACRLEHALFDGIDDQICTLLGHPAFCPHGKPIPSGECCRQHRATVSRLIAPLSELQVEQGGHIAYLQMNHPARLQKLMAMGVLPGSKICLLRRTPSFVFESGFSQFAVDEEIAGDIYVRLK